MDSEHIPRTGHRPLASERWTLGSERWTAGHQTLDTRRERALTDQFAKLVHGFAELAVALRPGGGADERADSNPLILAVGYQTPLEHLTQDLLPAPDTRQSARHHTQQLGPQLSFVNCNNSHLTFVCISGSQMTAEHSTAEDRGAQWEIGTGLPT